MKVKVLQHHIDEGERFSAHLCPVALAITEQTGETWGVTQSCIRSQDGLRSLNDPKLRWFVVGFDSGQPAEPTEFDFK